MTGPWSAKQPGPPQPGRSGAPDASPDPWGVRRAENLRTSLEGLLSARVVTDPVVVFEVLSPSTASTDIGVKNQEYRDTPSIQRYVMLSQDDQRATIFARAGDDWVGHIVAGDAILDMPEIGIEVSLAELYEGVSFARSAEQDAGFTG